MKWVRVKLSSLHGGYGHVGVSPPAPPLPFPADASTCYFSHSADLTVPWGTHSDGASSGDGFNARAAVAGLGSGYAVPINLICFQVVILMLQTPFWYSFSVLAPLISDVMLAHKFTLDIS